MNKTKIMTVFSIFLFIQISISISAANEISPKSEDITVKINIEPYTTIYEGDIISCTITGNPTNKYWYINDQSEHTTFHGNDPIIFDPEPTPLDTNYVSLTVYAENEEESASDTVKVMIKRIYFGDIHWHTTVSDGQNSIDSMYQGAIEDNYLDFVCNTEHAEWINNMPEGYTNLSTFWMFPEYWQANFGKLKRLLRTKLYHLRFGYNEWELIKQKANEYYCEGKFTTFLGYEWTAGYPNSGYPNFHINFYYKDIYPDAPYYSSEIYDSNCRPTLDDILQAMSDECDKGHYNIGFPHHPLFVPINWTFLANNVNAGNRERILRGVEVYSKHATAIGQNYTPGLPYNWPSKYFLYTADSPEIQDSWVENAMWAWSENSIKNQKFAFIASSDIHGWPSPGAARPEKPNFEPAPYSPAGLIASYAIHNNRSEIWDAIDNCYVYGTQLLKIRANVRFDGQMAYGRWINCTSPLKVTITAKSTFQGEDSSGKSMKPYGFPAKQLNNPIQDIWLIKIDRDKGKPWCKIINHSTPNSNVAVAEFSDDDVQPNDFYWVAIRQKGKELIPKYLPTLMRIAPAFYKKWQNYVGERDEYMAFIGPVFIDNVT
jgi:hypothetical protein